MCPFLNLTYSEPLGHVKQKRSEMKKAKNYPSETKSRIVSVRLTPSQFKSLADYCKQYDFQLSEIIRDSMETVFNHQTR